MLKKENSILIGIDIQEKLVNMLKENSAEAAAKSFKIIKAADILGIKTLITEQYPKGLGQTIKEIRDYLGEKYAPFEKTSFSAIKNKEIFEAVKNSDKKQVVLFGIEAHICVFQTALELFEIGYEVFVVSDISYSRCDTEKKTALQFLRHRGISIVTLEMVLFMWLEGSYNPNFKEVQALIK